MLVAVMMITLAIAGSSHPMRAEVLAPAETLKASRALPAFSRPPKRLFISGHSLTDAPFPQQLAAIAESLGHSLHWNVQNQFGSTLKERVENHRLGMDRDGAPVDMARAVRQPQPYDTWLVTEQHTLLDNLVWNDTAAHLRSFHRRAVEANPSAQTFLYQSWLGVMDRNDPGRWISYERAASPVWACLAEGVNHSLADEGYPGRILPLPAGLALAELVDRATTDGGLKPLSGANSQATMERLFRDDVHLTPAGSYYVALVSYAFLYRSPPLQAWFPPEMAPDTAAVLQQQAWGFTKRYLQNYRAPDPESCSRYVSETFVPIYLNYLRDLGLSQDGSLWTWVRWARFRVQWPRLFRQKGQANPLLRAGES